VPMKGWSIGIEAWVIEDGNYPDFQSGTIAEFAVEFYMSEWDAVSRPTTAVRSTSPGRAIGSSPR
jgi:hypothetical protein